MPHCSDCLSKACVLGTTNGALDDCPSKSNSPEFMLGLYNEEDRKISVEAAAVEAEGYTVNTRIEEIMDFAYKMGYKHLGLAFCAGFKAEAKIVTDVFKSNGFTVDSATCKNSCVAKVSVGVKSNGRLKPENEYEGMCNPIGQAYLLDEAGCDFVVVLGLCVGHDTMFLKHIKAPATILAVKDRAMGNNPLGAIYTANVYSKRIYNFIERKYGKK